MSLLSRKIKVEIKVREDKPPLVNQQCVVNCFLSVTCAMQNMSVQAIFPTPTPTNWITVVEEEHNKKSYECIFQMYFYLTLNKQFDSIRAKLFD